MKLLLVEDNPVDARLLREILKDTPHAACQLEHVTRMDAALECLRQQPFDLVLLDLGLPDSQGAQSVRRMNQAFPALPIIVLTGLENPEVALEAVRAGAQDYLVKGHFNAELLSRTIRYSIERKRASEELRQLNAVLERRVEERTAEYKQAAGTLRESEERNRLLVETMLQGVVHQDADGTIIAMNPAAERILGKSFQQLLNSNSVREEHQTIREDGSQFPGLEHPAMVALRTGQTVSEVVMGVFNPQLGAYRWISIDAVPILRPGESRPAEVYTVFEDITNRKRAEEAMRDKEDQLRLAQETANVGIWDWKVETGDLDFTPELNKLYGLPAGTIKTYQDWHVRVHPDDIEGIETERDEAITKHKSFNLEFRGRHSSGEYRWISTKGGAIYSETGKAVRVFGVNIDITERKQAEEALRESAQRLKFHLENSPLAVIEWDADFIVSQWSKEAQRIFGWNREEVLGKRIDTLNLIYPEDLPIVERTMERLTNGTELTVVSSNRNLNKSGNVITCTWHNSVLLNSDGKMSSVMSLVENITERKRAEEALRTSEERLALAITGTRLGMFDMNLATGEAVATDQHLSLLGLRPTTSTASVTSMALSQPHHYRQWAERVHPDDLPRIAAERNRCMAEHLPYETEYRVVWPDGSMHWLGMRAIFQYDVRDQPQRLLGVCMDITTRKQAELELVRRQRREEILAGIASRLLSADEPQQVVNDFCSTVMDFLECDVFFNFLADETSGRLRLNAASGIEPEEQEKLEWLDYGVAVCGCVAQQDQRIIIEDIPHAKDPRAAMVASYGVLAYCCHPLTVQGRVIGTLSFGTRRRTKFSEDDVAMMAAVTEQVAMGMQRLRDQEALRRSEALYRGIGESIDYGVWVCAPDGRNTYASESFLKMVGITQEQCSNFGWGDVLHPDDAKSTVTAWQECVRTGGNWDIEHRFRGTDGQWHHVLARGVPVRNDQGEILSWAGINLDISRLKQAEEQLKHSLEEKEVLLKEIHHRVKNNLQVISSLISLQAAGLSDDRVREALGDIGDRIRTIALVHEKFYQTDNLAQLNFSDYAASLLNHLWHTHGTLAGRVRFTLAMEPVMMPIESTVTCGLILNELAGNALKHAFPNGRAGEVTVGLDRNPATDTLCLWVRDYGIGLPEELEWRQAKTLGLRLVRILAGQLRGTVATGPGPGAEFRVTFIQKGIHS
jgi:PAS domain S-box-containing protein